MGVVRKTGRIILAAVVHNFFSTLRCVTMGVYALGLGRFKEFIGLVVGGW